MDARVNVAHIVSADNGHCPDVDCWCEPSEIRWITNVYGIKVLIVMHEDILPPLWHHSVIVEARNESTEDWISRFLDTIEEKEPSDGTND